MEALPEQALRAWVEYLREMGVYDLYRHPQPSTVLPEATLAHLRTARVAATPTAMAKTAGAPTRPGSNAGPGRSRPVPSAVEGMRPATFRPPETQACTLAHPVPLQNHLNAEPEVPLALPPELAAPMPKPQALQDLLPAADPVAPADRVSALERLRAEIGDCTRCPLAYAGRHTIVFGTGDPNAQLMFVGEGPGADEDASGEPFVGKAGQLLNNMIGAMGLAREQVYIANIVKCRPPGNRTPEFVEATTCSQFLLRQIDTVRPKVIVALGATAATYVLGVRQSLASLRGQWFSSRGAKVAVTYHPAFLLRDPRQKPEAWKDLQRVMAELGLVPPSRAGRSS